MCSLVCTFRRRTPCSRASRRTSSHLVEPQTRSPAKQESHQIPFCPRLSFAREEEEASPPRRGSQAPDIANTSGFDSPPLPDIRPLPGSARCPYACEKEHAAPLSQVPALKNRHGTLARGSAPSSFLTAPPLAPGLPFGFPCPQLLQTFLNAKFTLRQFGQSQSPGLPRPLPLPLEIDEFSLNEFEFGLN